MQTSDGSNANDRDDLSLYRRDSEALPGYESTLRLPKYSENSPETTPNGVRADEEQPVSFIRLCRHLKYFLQCYWCRTSTDYPSFLVFIAPGLTWIAT